VADQLLRLKKVCKAYNIGQFIETNESELFPLILERRLFIATALLATLTGLLAATAPAVRAAKLDPVVAIRG